MLTSGCQGHIILLKQGPSCNITTLLKLSQGALKSLLDKAEQGHVDTQAILGAIYYNEQDYQEAVKWYRRAAEQGHGLAQSMLALIYHEGDGVEQNYKEAAKWYRRRAEQGHAASQHQLGTMHCDGVGVPKDYEEAAKWFRRAAEQGHAKAQFHLGTLFTGVMVKNYVFAYKWFSLAISNPNNSKEEKLDYLFERDGLVYNMTDAQIFDGQQDARFWKPKTWEEWKVVEARIKGRLRQGKWGW